MDKRSPIKVLFITTVSHVMQHIYVGSSVLLPLIIADLKLNYTEFGLAIAISSLIGGFSQVLFSIASRKIARHILLGLGNILLSLGTFLTGLARKMMDFLGARLLSNVGVAPQHPMGTAIVSENFDEKSLGRALGIHYGLAYLGNIIGPVIMTFLAATLGWRKTLFIFSIPALVVGLTVIWYLGGVRGTSRYRDAKEIESSKRSSLKNDVLMILKTRDVVAVIAAQALLSGGIDIGILTTYIPVFLANFLEMNIYERGIVYTIGLLGGVIGPILLGSYASRVGYIKMSIASALSAATLLLFLAPYSPGANAALISAHLFSLMFVSFSLPTLLQSQLVRVSSGYSRDLVVGIFFTIGFAFSSMWTGIVGYVIDKYSSFQPAFILMGALGFLAPLILMRRTTKSR
ncbi:MFS transporter [Candidatus Bathyarchaeota archaeon]|nr:MFS transporter [Candidatus Bathyarchaeota archaeon]